ncbi:CDP-glycerol glycerophosphotransferase family protein [Buttiauxella sp. A2-C1_F]|uniref:CDP-glycerol glycerophosphotransferase family protein n=1 Tax=Buttiauxella sp. A2-C1_F TaxID=2904526 RepID=UPI001E55BEEB|nr:CDP-glycerol glycerophosphotransferase family protein [Buttiauxella sp. A2-C1_F]MCE0846443.1 CDP-glycerol glycerophosphotransferase family protein [Buttiauxella sp. A2-C1_F]
MFKNIVRKVLYVWHSNRRLFISEKFHAFFLKPKELLVIDIDLSNRILLVYSKDKPEMLISNIKYTASGCLYNLSFSNLTDEVSALCGWRVKYLNNYYCISNAYKKSVLEIFHLIKTESVIDNLVVFSDRDSHADDNAEHLVKYILLNKPELTKSNFFYFINTEVNSNEDIENIRISPFSYTHEILLKHCGKYVSSQIDFAKLQFLHAECKFIFLQHGVTLNDISSWLNMKKIDLIVTSTCLEHACFVDESSAYRITEREAFLGGMPRFDYLYENKNTCIENSILIAPTWRSYKVDSSEMRAYINAWCKLLLSSSIYDLSLKYDIVFIAHPKLQDLIFEKIKVPKYVLLKKPNDSYSSIFLKSKILITDYSSISFDMAYLSKYTIYYQFDKDSYFSSGVVKNNKGKGFCYYENGFGPVCHSLTEVSDKIVAFFDNEWCGEYAQRFEMNFKHIDGNNCQRLVAKLFESC